MLERDVLVPLRKGKNETALIGAASVGGRYMDMANEVAWANASVQRACSKGCSYCCHIRVDVTIAEVARAVAFARAKLSPDVLKRVEEHAHHNALLTHSKTNLFYPLNLPCAFLGEDGACLVYEARPTVCGAEHSLNADECRQGFEVTEMGVDYPISKDVTAMVLTSKTTLAFREALRKGGVNPTGYEFQEAVSIAFKTPDAFDRWLRGDDVFDAALLNTQIDPGEILPHLVER